MSDDWQEFKSGEASDSWASFDSVQFVEAPFVAFPAVGAPVFPGNEAVTFPPVPVASTLEAETAQASGQGHSQPAVSVSANLPDQTTQTTTIELQNSGNNNNNVAAPTEVRGMEPTDFANSVFQQPAAFGANFSAVSFPPLPDSPAVPEQPPTVTADSVAFTSFETAPDATEANVFGDFVGDAASASDDVGTVVYSAGDSEGHEWRTDENASQPAEDSSKRFEEVAAQQQQVSVAPSEPARDVVVAPPEVEVSNKREETAPVVAPVAVSQIDEGALVSSVREEFDRNSNAEAREDASLFLPENAQSSDEGPTLSQQPVVRFEHVARVYSPSMTRLPSEELEGQRSPSPSPSLPSPASSQDKDADALSAAVNAANGDAGDGGAFWDMFGGSDAQEAAVLAVLRRSSFSLSDVLGQEDVLQELGGSVELCAYFLRPEVFSQLIELVVQEASSDLRSQFMACQVLCFQLASIGEAFFRDGSAPLLRLVTALDGKPPLPTLSTEYVCRVLVRLLNSHAEQALSFFRDRPSTVLCLCRNIGRPGCVSALSALVEASCVMVSQETPVAGVAETGAAPAVVEKAVKRLKNDASEWLASIGVIPELVRALLPGPDVDSPANSVSFMQMLMNVLPKQSALVSEICSPVSLALLLSALRCFKTAPPSFRSGVDLSVMIMCSDRLQPEEVASFAPEVWSAVEPHVTQELLTGADGERLGLNRYELVQLCTALALLGNPSVDACISRIQLPSLFAKMVLRWPKSNMLQSAMAHFFSSTLRGALKSLVLCDDVAGVFIRRLRDKMEAWPHEADRGFLVHFCFELQSLRSTVDTIESYLSDNPDWSSDFQQRLVEEVELQKNNLCGVVADKSQRMQVEKAMRVLNEWLKPRLASGEGSATAGGGVATQARFGSPKPSEDGDGARPPSPQVPLKAATVDSDKELPVEPAIGSAEKDDFGFDDGPVAVELSATTLDQEAPSPPSSNQREVANVAVSNNNNSGAASSGDVNFSDFEQSPPTPTAFDKVDFAGFEQGPSPVSTAPAEAVATPKTEDVAFGDFAEPANVEFGAFAEPVPVAQKLADAEQPASLTSDAFASAASDTAQVPVEFGEFTPASSESQPEFGDFAAAPAVEFGSFEEPKDAAGFSNVEFGAFDQAAVPAETEFKAFDSSAVKKEPEAVAAPVVAAPAPSSSQQGGWAAFDDDASSKSAFNAAASGISVQAVGGVFREVFASFGDSAAKASSTLVALSGLDSSKSWDALLKGKMEKAEHFRYAGSCAEGLVLKTLNITKLIETAPAAVLLPSRPSVPATRPLDPPGILQPTPAAAPAPAPANAILTPSAAPILVPTPAAAVASSRPEVSSPPLFGAGAVDSSAPSNNTSNNVITDDDLGFLAMFGTSSNNNNSNNSSVAKKPNHAVGAPSVSANNSNASVFPDFLFSNIGSEPQKAPSAEQQKATAEQQKISNLVGQLSDLSFMLHDTLAPKKLPQKEMLFF